MTKEIPLTRGMVALVDDEDFDRLVSMGKWHVLHSAGGGFYAGKRRPSSEIRLGKSTIIFMHNYIMNTDETGKVDHYDRNGLNNQKYNLRFATKSQQMQNRRMHSNNKSGYKGVSWNRYYKKWQVFLRDNKKPIGLGLFDSKYEAAKAYDRKAREIYGEFAVLNFGDEQ